MASARSLLSDSNVMRLLQKLIIRRNTTLFVSWSFLRKGVEKVSGSLFRSYFIDPSSLKLGETVNNKKQNSIGFCKSTK